MNTLLKNDGIKNWNSTWKHHHLPGEIKKRIRFEAVRNGNWKPSFSRAEDFLPHALFDHWGSFCSKGKTRRSIASMPYGGNDEQAKAWANTHGMGLTISESSPYGHGTRLYIFTLDT